MTFKIYYDEIDGNLHPKWGLLPNFLQEECKEVIYSVESPFERFSQEDFNDEMKLVTVSQGALTACPLYNHQFKINIEQLIRDLTRQNHHIDSIYSIDYFVILVDDLEELLNYDVINRFIL